MSDHKNSNPCSDNEQAAPVTPTMKRALAIVDLQASAEGASTTPLPTEASITSPIATPINGTPNRSSYVWSQPRTRSTPANETVDSGVRRTPAGIRALSESRKSSKCTLQSDETRRTRANTFKGESAASIPQKTHMIDQRPGGGFYRPDVLRPKSRRVKWTSENDRQLLLFGFGRDISGKEYQAIADSFKENPTAKAVQERLTKLRAAGRKVLKDSGIFDPDAPRNMSTASQTPAPRDMSAAPQVPSGPQPATPTQQQSARKRLRPSKSAAASEATEAVPSRGLSDNLTFQTPSQGTLQRLDAARTFTHGTLPSQSPMQMGQQQSRTMSFPPYQTASPDAGMGEYMGMSRFMAPSSLIDMSPTSYMSAGRSSSAGHEPQMLPPPMPWIQQQQSSSLYHCQQHSSPAMTGPPLEHGGNTTASANANMSPMAGKNSDDEEGEGEEA
jgi:hypothetical protein